MNRLLPALLLTVTLLAAPAALYAGEGPELSVGTDQAFLTKYIWRGLNATDDWVWEPNVWATYGSITLDVWGNLELTDVNGESGNFTEIDYTLEYSNSFGDLGVLAGGVYYAFPTISGGDTAELYAGLSYDMILSPAVTVYYDVVEANGLYALISLGHSFDLFETDSVSASIDLSATAGIASNGWNEYYYGADETAFVDVTAGASMPIGLGEYFTLTTSCTYSTVVDKTLRSNAANDHEWICGVTLSAETGL